MQRHEIVVLGAGPAGASVALGLARLGYRVGVVHAPRPFAACEGISERVVRALADLGLARTVAALPEPSPRRAQWNGGETAANRERLIERAAFDACLLADLAAHDIALHPGRVRGCTTAASGARIALEGGVSLAAEFVVDARGRAAPATRLRLRGPETLALVQRWHGPPAAAASGICAFDGGWCWHVTRADGSRYVQLTVAADAVPKRAQLPGWLAAQFATIPALEQLLRDCRADGLPQARASTSILQAPLVGQRALRAGDAAMAVDPLSGNGIFQALSSAAVAPAVVNTLLRHPQQAALARDFYAERVGDIFRRFARSGRGFYAGETRFATAPFWRARAHWPDEAPAHALEPVRVSGLAERAVVDQGRIRAARVVLTGDQPLGVWRVAGLEIAPLLAGEADEDGLATPSAIARRIARACGGDAARVAVVRGWCAAHGIDLPATD